MAILGALRRELKFVRSEIRTASAYCAQKGVRWWAGTHHGQKVMLVETGVGPDRARRAAELLVACTPVSALISVGYACALLGEMKIGDLVVGDRAFFLDQGGLGPYEADGQLMDIAQRASNGPWAERVSNGFGADRVADGAGPEPPRSGHKNPFAVYKGPILTVPRIVAEVAKKRELAARSGAVALDMESAAVAEVAREAKVAYLSIRAISDLVDEDLTGFSSFLGPDGSFRVFRAIPYLFTHPFFLARLNRVRSHTALASERLGRFVHDYLHRL